MGFIVSKFLYMPPTPTYDLTTFPYHLVFIPHSPTIPIPNTTATHTPCLLFNQPNAKRVVIYSHGNAADLGTVFAESCYLSHYLEAHIIAVEYPGYGIYQASETNESNTVANLLTVVEYVKDHMKCSLSNVFLYGRSLGTGVSSQVAAILTEKFPNYGVSIQESSEPKKFDTASFGKKLQYPSIGANILANSATTDFDTNTTNISVETTTESILTSLHTTQSAITEPPIPLPQIAALARTQSTVYPISPPLTITDTDTQTIVHPQSSTSHHRISQPTPPISITPTLTSADPGINSIPTPNLIPPETSQINTTVNPNDASPVLVDELQVETDVDWSYFELDSPTSASGASVASPGRSRARVVIDPKSLSPLPITASTIAMPILSNSSATIVPTAISTSNTTQTTSTVKIKTSQSLTPLAGLILHSPFSSVNDIIKSAAYTTFLLTDHYKTKDVIPKIKCPTLFIHGMKDRLIPYSHSQLLMSYSGGVKKRLFLSPTADHNHFQYRDEVIKPINTFIQQYCTIVHNELIISSKQDDIHSLPETTTINAAASLGNDDLIDATLDRSLSTVARTQSILSNQLITTQQQERTLNLDKVVKLHIDSSLYEAPTPIIHHITHVIPLTYPTIYPNHVLRYYCIPYQHFVDKIVIYNHKYISFINHYNTQQYMMKNMLKAASQDDPMTSAEDDAMLLEHVKNLQHEKPAVSTIYYIEKGITPQINMECNGNTSGDSTSTYHYQSVGTSVAKSIWIERYEHLLKAQQQIEVQVNTIQRKLQHAKERQYKRQQQAEQSQKNRPNHNTPTPSSTDLSCPSTQPTRSPKQRPDKMSLLTSEESAMSTTNDSNSLDVLQNNSIDRSKLGSTHDKVFNPSSHQTLLEPNSQVIKRIQLPNTLRKELLLLPQAEFPSKESASTSLVDIGKIHHPDDSNCTPAVPSHCSPHHSDDSYNHEKAQLSHYSAISSASTIHSVPNSRKESDDEITANITPIKSAKIPHYDAAGKKLSITARARQSLIESRQGQAQQGQAQQPLEIITKAHSALDSPTQSSTVNVDNLRLDGSITPKTFIQQKYNGNLPTININSPNNSSLGSQSDTECDNDLYTPRNTNSNLSSRRNSDIDEKSVIESSSTGTSSTGNLLDDATLSREYTLRINDFLIEHQKDKSSIDELIQQQIQQQRTYMLRQNYAYSRSVGTSDNDSTNAGTDTSTSGSSTTSSGGFRMFKHQQMVRNNSRRYQQFRADRTSLTPSSTSPGELSIFTPKSPVTPLTPTSTASINNPPLPSQKPLLSPSSTTQIDHTKPPMTPMTPTDPASGKWGVVNMFRKLVKEKETTPAHSPSHSLTAAIPRSNATDSKNATISNSLLKDNEALQLLISSANDHDDFGNLGLASPIGSGQDGLLSDKKQEPLPKLDEENILSFQAFQYGHSRHSIAVTRGPAYSIKRGSSSTETISELQQEDGEGDDSIYEYSSEASELDETDPCYRGSLMNDVDLINGDEYYLDSPIKSDNNRKDPKDLDDHPHVCGQDTIKVDDFLQ